MSFKDVRWVRLAPLALLIAGIMIFSTPMILGNTTWINYKSDKVQEAIQTVESSSNTNYEKIVNTAKYIHDNTEYEYQGEACLQQKPEDVLSLGKGDCVSFSKVAASMLTGMNIPVQIVEGCVFQNRQTTTDEKIPPKDFTIPRDYEVKKQYLTDSRTTGPSSGQLHNWVRAYDGQQWWTIETTAGVVFPVNYEEFYGYNKFGGTVNAADPWDLCLLTDQSYVEFCSTG